MLIVAIDIVVIVMIVIVVVANSELLTFRLFQEIILTNEYNVFMTFLFQVFIVYCFCLSLLSLQSMSDKSLSQRRWGYPFFVFVVFWSISWNRVASWQFMCAAQNSSVTCRGCERKRKCMWRERCNCELMLLIIKTRTKKMYVNAL